MIIKPEDIYKIAPHHRFQWEKAQDCYVILFPEGMVKLNGGAGEVLNLVDGVATVATIIKLLTFLSGIIALALAQTKFALYYNMTQEKQKEMQNSTNISALY